MRNSLGHIEETSYLFLAITIDFYKRKASHKKSFAFRVVWLAIFEYHVLSYIYMFSRSMCWEKDIARSFQEFAPLFLKAI